MAIGSAADSMAYVNRLSASLDRHKRADASIREASSESAQAAIKSLGDVQQRNDDMVAKVKEIAARTINSHRIDIFV